MLADRFGEKTKDGIRIKAPIRHQDIAESVNCSRETASRELAKLNKKGLIGTVDGNICVKEVGKLMDQVGVQSNLRKRLKRLI